MKKPNTQLPRLDRKKAKRVPPYRHTKTARTVAWEQEEGGDKHLFTATGQHVAAEKAEKLKSENAEMNQGGQAAQPTNKQEDKAVSEKLKS